MLPEHVHHFVDIPPHASSIAGARVPTSLHVYVLVCACVPGCVRLCPGSPSYLYTMLIPQFPDSDIRCHDNIHGDDHYDDGKIRGRAKRGRRI